MTQTISVPSLHPGQAVVDASSARYNALVCGRRWGKSKYLVRRMVKAAASGKSYGYFGATYKLLTEVFAEAAHRLAPIAEVSKSERAIRTASGGLIEFWTLQDDDAGRSRRYHEVGIDEAGLVGNLEQLWHQAIRPTLADFRGSAWFAGTPKGKGFFWQAYALGQDPEQNDWASWRMPTSANPYIDPLEIAAAEKDMPSRAFEQEFLAMFLDEAGGVFLGVRDAVDHGVTGREPEGAVSLGVDLARIEDFTVVSGIDSAGRQVWFERYNQISWERQIGRILAAYERFPGATITIDSTGVGDPIFERLRATGARVTGYGLTSASKEALIDNLAMGIEQGRYRLLDVPEQTNELLAYQYELTPSRNVRMNAPEGMHDDTVIALALAAWAHRPDGKRRIALL